MNELVIRAKRHFQEEELHYLCRELNRQGYAIPPGSRVRIRCINPAYVLYDMSHLDKEGNLKPGPIVKRIALIKSLRYHLADEGEPYIGLREAKELSDNTVREDGLVLSLFPSDKLPWIKRQSEEFFSSLEELGFSHEFF